MKRALDDIRVVEYAEMMSGPMCGKMLSDMGAEVIKIEPPGCGDRSRHLPPFAADVAHPEKSGMFLYLNTGKKSVTLDPIKPSGGVIFKNLVSEADIVIENHPAGLLASIGFVYESLLEFNHRLIVASIAPLG